MNTDRHRWKTIVSYLCSSVFICGPLAACAFLASLSLLSLQRGRVWASTLTIFEDAVRKQPRASFAYFGLGSAYGQIWENNRRNPRADQHKVEEVRQLFLQTWKNGLDRCPDAERYTIYLVMAVNVGEELCRQAGEERDAGKRQKKLQAAEYYLLKAARPPLETADSPAVRAVALTDLAALRIAQGDPGAAYRFACDAVAASDEPPARLVRARAAVSLASSLRQSGNKEPTKAQELIAQAREDASLVPAGAATYSQAQELLRDPIFKQ